MLKMIKKHRIGKSRAIRSRCQQGHTHPSKAEALHCNVLHLVMKDPKQGIKVIEYEKKYPLMVNGVLVGTHKPDWTVHRQDGSWYVVEYKGFHKNKREWILRKKLFMALYPGIKYNVVGTGK